ncbi:glycosyltransferase [Gordonia sp. SL306]|uniref:glycosyltransferase n=1 Tax=Gordonia sp. SL306 TaxID=2995145 RepID=UPI00226D769C|nr:glycosyltransferase [Gordonia sp. SL306]WAC57807.1 glycosyltransferase [Gordonia sp. SL306]
MVVLPVSSPGRPAPDRVVVVVPAHNEERLLPACIAALDDATSRVAVPVELVVVLDACTDGSAGLIPEHVTTVIGTARSVGAARRSGFAPYLDVPHAHRTWFATTDADSEVPPDWLATHLDVAGRGADAFVGTISPKNWDSWSPHTALIFGDRYLPGDGHFHVHGANLGVRADWYRRVGGFAARTGDEDVDLVRRLRAAGARIDRSGRSPVTTSTRAVGRTDAGFAAYLNRLETLGRQDPPERKVSP